MTFIAPSDAEAEDKYNTLRDLLSEDWNMANLARLCGGLDIRAYDPDGPLPDLPPSNAAKARQGMVKRWASEEGLTIRQIAARLGASQGHNVIHGSPRKVADMMQEWLEADACDGFNLLFPFFPSPLDDFVNLLVPELQRRGIFRTEYEGPTLRDVLGVPVPASRYAAR
jgi:N-acetyl-S-(2-succino)cysteine monooxygenase